MQKKLKSINHGIKRILFIPVMLCFFALNTHGQSQKVMHISFDDVHYVLQNLTVNKNTYQSIFENPMLNKLKLFHDTYGAVFSLYCFDEFELSVGNVWRIEALPTAFAQEFVQNSSWLKIGFHSRGTATGSAEYNIGYYNTFTTVMPDIEGRENCFDLIPRLHGFAGSLDFCKSLKNANPGLIGFLSADDTRASYYLNSTQSSYINSNDSLHDLTNDLYFFRTEKRLESVSNINTFLAQYLTPAYASQANVMVIFTHENQLYSHYSGLNTTNGMLTKIDGCIKWAVANNYKFDYPMNIIKKAPTSVNAIGISDYISIKGNTICSSEIGSLKVFNLSGALVFQQENVLSIDTNLSSGIYALQFMGLDGGRTFKKFIIK